MTITSALLSVIEKEGKQTLTYPCVQFEFTKEPHEDVPFLKISTIVNDKVVNYRCFDYRSNLHSLVIQMEGDIIFKTDDTTDSITLAVDIVKLSQVKRPDDVSVRKITLAEFKLFVEKHPPIIYVEFPFQYVLFKYDISTQQLMCRCRVSNERESHDIMLTHDHVIGDLVDYIYTHALRQQLVSGKTSVTKELILSFLHELVTGNYPFARGVE